MNIHVNQGLRAFQNTSKIGAPTATAAAPKADPNTAAASPPPSTQVTISSAAQALAAKDSETTRTPAQARFLANLADESDADVDKIAHEMAYGTSDILYDISHGDIRLSSTGEVVGDDDIANFKKLAASVDAGQRALYESEKAKGTDPKEIVAKLFDYRSAQSAGYREGTAWGYA